MEKSCQLVRHNVPKGEFAMGQRHSKRPKKLESQPEVTEIIELNDNQSETEDNNQIVIGDKKSSEQIVYPLELKQVMEAVDLIEQTLEAMTTSQIDLYYATLKDDLHKHWQRLYKVPDNGDKLVKMKKIEAIERLKTVLQRLNSKVLINGYAMHN